MKAWILLYEYYHIIQAVKGIKRKRSKEKKNNNEKYKNNKLTLTKQFFLKAFIFIDWPI